MRPLMRLDTRLSALYFIDEVLVKVVAVTDLIRIGIPTKQVPERTTARRVGYFVELELPTNPSDKARTVSA